MISTDDTLCLSPSCSVLSWSLFSNRSISCIVIVPVFHAVSLTKASTFRTGVAPKSLRGDRRQDKAQYSEHADELLAHHRCTSSQTGTAHMAGVTRKLHTPGSASSIFPRGSHAGNRFLVSNRRTNMKFCTMLPSPGCLPRVATAAARRVHVRPCAGIILSACTSQADRDRTQPGLRTPRPFVSLQVCAVATRQMSIGKHGKTV